MGTFLEINGVRRAFGGLVAVADVSLSVARGEIHAVIGPNGAGKSTLFNIVSGMLAPDRGTIVFDGEDITGRPAHVIARLGLGRCFQRASIFPQLLVCDNVRVALLAHAGRTYDVVGGASEFAAREVEEILEDVGLAEFYRRPAAALAHGDRKRLEFGIALAGKPKLLLLDEPTAGMSPEETAATISLVRKVVHDRGITAVFIEHDMSLVFDIADRITVMHQGRVLAQGSADGIRSNEEVQRVYLGESSWYSN